MHLPCASQEAAQQENCCPEVVRGRSKVARRCSCRVESALDNTRSCRSHNLFSCFYSFILTLITRPYYLDHDFFLVIPLPPSTSSKHQGTSLSYALITICSSTCHKKTTTIWQPWKQHSLLHSLLTIDTNSVPHADTMGDSTVNGDMPHSSFLEVSAP